MSNRKESLLKLSELSFYFFGGLGIIVGNIIFFM